MTKAGDIFAQIESWIAANYYLEMEQLLVDAGWTCESQADAPWYTTNCPRSAAMTLHNEALTNLLQKLKDDHSLGHLVHGTMTMMLKQKFFSDRDINRQVVREQAGA